MEYYAAYYYKTFKHLKLLTAFEKKHCYHTTFEKFNPKISKQYFSQLFRKSKKSIGMLGCGWGEWVEKGGPSKRFAGLNFSEKKNLGNVYSKPKRQHYNLIGNSIYFD